MAARSYAASRAAGEQNLPDVWEATAELCRQFELARRQARGGPNRATTIKRSVSVIDVGAAAVVVVTAALIHSRSIRVRAPAPFPLNWAVEFGACRNAQRNPF
jgi:hypothetical protein